MFPDDDVAIAAAAALATRAESLAGRAPSLLAEGRMALLVDELAEVERGLDEVDTYVSMRQYADAGDEGVQSAVVGVRAATTPGHAALETALDAWRALTDDAAARVLADPALAPAAYRLGRARTESRHRLDPYRGGDLGSAQRDGKGSVGEPAGARRGRGARGVRRRGGERGWGIGDLSMVLRRPDPDLRRAAWAALADLRSRTQEVVALAWDAAVADRIAEDRLRGRDHPVAETLEREDMALEDFDALLDAVEGRP